MMKKITIFIGVLLAVGNLHAMELSAGQRNLADKVIAACIKFGKIEVQKLIDMDADLAPELNRVINLGIPVSEFLIEKMLSIPTPEQKARVYAFGQCLKRMCPGQFHNVSDVFKSHLRALIVKENTHKACRAVCGLGESLTKTLLVQKYFATEVQLCIAAYAGDFECVQRLIAQDVGVDDYVDSDNRTALFCAASVGWGDITRLLIDAGADVYQKNKKGISVLKEAVAPSLFCTVRPPCEYIVEKMISQDGKVRARTEVDNLVDDPIKRHLLYKYFPNHAVDNP